MKLTSEQLHILQHSLGVNQYGQGSQYRNRFVTGPGTTDWSLFSELVALEMMKDYGPQQIAGGMHCFCVTPKGIDAVALQSPPPPKVSRGKQRYRDYLRSELNMSFIDYLRWRDRRAKEEKYA